MAPTTSSLALSSLPRSDIPQIGGSSASFVALTVTLALIIILSCAAVLFNIHRNKRSKAEQEARRLRARHNHPKSRSAPDFNYTMAVTSEPRSAITWKDKIGGVFGFGSGSAKGSDTPRGSLGRTRSHGWVQAGSGDDWDLHVGHERSGSITPTKASPLQEREADGGSAIGIAFSSTAHPHSTTPPDEPFPPPPVAYLRSPQSSSSLRLDVKLPGPMFDYAYEPLAVVAQENTTPVPRPPIPRSTSPETMPGSPSTMPFSIPDNRVSQISTQSIASIRTFQGGTKFIEAL